MTLSPGFGTGNVPFLDRGGLETSLFPFALGDKRRDRKGPLGLATNSRGGGLGEDQGDQGAPLPSAAPEAGTIAFAGGAGRAWREGVAPLRAPPPARPPRSHTGSHRAPTAARPGTARGSRRRRARHGRPPVSLGARGRCAARGRARRPGTPRLLPLRQGRRQGRLGARVSRAGAWGQESSGGCGRRHSGGAHGDTHTTARTTGTCHAHRYPRGHTHARSCRSRAEVSPTASRKTTQ